MINPDTVHREKLLFAYTSALEQGNFARLEQILELARSDAALESQIGEINSVLSQPRKAPETPLAPETTFAKLWRRIQSSAAGLRSKPHVLRNIAFGLSAMIVVTLGVLALLGPAIGKVFSNVVTSLPDSAYTLQTPRAATAGQTNYPAPGRSMSPAATQIASSQGYAYNNTYPSPESQQLTSQPADRLIVRNGTLTVVTKNTLAARQAVTAMITEFSADGAYVVSSNETFPYDDKMPAIFMLLRVPVKRYDESMTRLAGLGIQVLGRKETAQDVTQEYVDTSARIEALQASRARLLGIIKEAKNTDDLLRAEQELARREAELESVKARQQYLEKTAALSSITLELRPTVTSQPVTDNAWDPAATLHKAVRSLLATLRSLADGTIFFAVTTLPWLAVLSLLIYAAIRLLRKRSKK
jgi:hypothetical protein